MTAGRRTRVLAGDRPFLESSGPNGYAGMAGGTIEPTTCNPATHSSPTRRAQMTRARLKITRPVWVVIRRSHNVPVESHPSSES